jgi:hypothetical protein
MTDPPKTRVYNLGKSDRGEQLTFGIPASEHSLVRQPGRRRRLPGDDPLKIDSDPEITPKVLGIGAVAMRNDVLLKRLLP